jgi:hypothetical protein
LPYVGGNIALCFPEEPTRDACREMAEHGGEQMKRLAQVKTPVRTGILRESWKRKPLEIGLSATGHAEYRSGAETDVEYAPYIEHGTGTWGPKHAPYVILPKKPGGVLHWKNKAGEDVFARRVVHPGIHGHHMMADAAGLLEIITPMLMVGELEKWKQKYELAIDVQKL